MIGPIVRESASALLAPWLVLLIVGLPLAIGDARAESVERWSGRRLVEVLDELNAHGVPLLYSSQLVTPELTIESEPKAAAVRDRLEEALKPHGLALEETDGLLLVIRAPQAQRAQPGRLQVIVLKQGGLPPDDAIEIRAHAYGRFLPFM